MPLDNILFDEKSYENILIYDISHKHLIGAKLDRLIRFYDGTRYLVLFGPQYDAIYHRIRYLINQKSGIRYLFLIIIWKSKFINMIFYL